MNLEHQKYSVLNRFTFNMPKYQKDKLQKIYRETGESLAHQIRAAINNELKRKENNE